MSPLIWLGQEAITEVVTFPDKRPIFDIHFDPSLTFGIRSTTNPWCLISVANIGPMGAFSYAELDRNLSNKRC